MAEPNQSMAAVRPASPPPQARPRSSSLFAKAKQKWKSQGEDSVSFWSQKGGVVISSGGGCSQQSAKNGYMRSRTATMDSYGRNANGMATLHIPARGAAGDQHPNVICSNGYCMIGLLVMSMEVTNDSMLRDMTVDYRILFGMTWFFLFQLRCAVLLASALIGTAELCRLLTLSGHWILAWI